MATKHQTGEIVTLINNGIGEFSFGLVYLLATSPTSVKLADLNGDQFTDIVVGTRAGVFILQGNGTGIFSLPKQYQIPSVDAGKIEVGDFNGDQKIDVAAISFSASSAVILINDGVGNLIEPRMYSTVAQSQAITVADF